MRIGTRAPRLGPKKRTKGEVRYNVASLSSRGIVFWFVGDQSNMISKQGLLWSDNASKASARLSTRSRHLCTDEVLNSRNNNVLLLRR